jgi:arylsulfatase
VLRFKAAARSAAFPLFKPKIWHVNCHFRAIDSSIADRMDPQTRPNFLRGKAEFTYYPGMFRIPEANSPDVHNKSFRVAADVEIPNNGADGVLATQGGRFGGWSLLVLDGKPMFAYAVTNQDGEKFPKQRRTRPGSPAATSSPGKHTIVFDFVYDGGGLCRPSGTCSAKRVVTRRTRASGI